VSIAALLLGVTRLGLWLLPFRRLLRLRAFMSHKVVVGPALDHATIDRVAWAVEVAGRHMPTTTCLSQALVTQMLLGRLGYPSSLCIGVARDAVGQFEAHAWIECGGKIVMGDWEDLSRYTVLPPLEDL
jgi:hypothetical protein